MTTSVDLLVPAARAAVGDWYDRTPAAAEGMPPHLTLLWPWVDPVTPDALQRLARALAGQPAVEVVFASSGRFPGTAFLVPSPSGSLRALAARARAAFPEVPPYGGAFGPDPALHLTVARSEDEGALDEVEEEVRSRLARPLSVLVDRVSLSERRPEPNARWSVTSEIPLG